MEPYFEVLCILMASLEVNVRFRQARILNLIHIFHNRSY